LQFIVWMPRASWQAAQRVNLAVRSPQPTVCHSNRLMSTYEGAFAAFWIEQPDDGEHIRIGGR
jgi:hypothetical protein